MLHNAATIGGKDWNKPLPHILSSYQKVLQEYTVFSQFGMLHGRELQGQLNIVKEMWEVGLPREKSVLSYVDHL